MSGSGTNIGIDYQQRVAGLLLAYLYGKIDAADLLAVPGELYVTRVAFEVDDSVDDVALKSADNRSFFLQVKRSLSLSEKEDSDFYGVIEQFVSEFIEHPEVTRRCVLVVSGNSSKRIKYELRKLLESARLDCKAFEKNPLTVSEADTLRVLRSTFDILHGKLSKAEPSSDEFLDFCRRISVAVIDIESGMPIEKSVILLLKSLGFPSPELIWGMLVKKCLHFASQRLSVDYAGLVSILDGFRTEAVTLSSDMPFDSQRNNILQMVKKLPAGKEVLLVKSFEERLDYMIVELFRFDDNGKKKVRFINGKLKLFKEDSVECDVLFRSGSISAVESFIENDPQFKDSRVALLGANDIEGVEDSDPAKLQNASMMAMLERRAEIESCLHCNKGIMDMEAYLVEIDERPLPQAVGFVHRRCRRPMDRVLGVGVRDSESEFEIPDGFDVRQWIELLRTGQRLVSNLKAGVIPMETVMAMAWSSDFDHSQDYQWCVRFELQGGGERYEYSRGKIACLKKVDAESHVIEFLKLIQSQKDKNDPMCFSSKNLIFASYSRLISVIGGKEEALEIEAVSIAPYTKLLSKIYDECENYYAPLLLVEDVGSELPLVINGGLILISDPLKLANMRRNWERAGIEIGEIRLKMIHDDRQFDDLMRNLTNDGLIAVVDPLMDQNQNLVGGLRIAELNMLSKTLIGGNGEPRRNSTER